MKLFAHDQHHHDDPWAGASARELELAAILLIILERVDTMAVDVSKLVASEVKLVADVDTLITSAQANSAKLTDISAQLAAAIAANDPAAQKAAQDAIDGVATALDAESSKVEATQTPPVGTP